MKVAILGDIHGNLRALEAVLQDAITIGAEQYIFLGDLVFMGLDPQLCYDLLMEQKPMVAIKGNTDENLEDLTSFIPSSPYEESLVKLIKYCDIRMYPEAKKNLASWPIAQQIQIEGHTIICCHGTPYSNREWMQPHEPFAPVLAKKLSLEEASVILCAHTHIKSDFQHHGKRIINPGAIGYSFDGVTTASYALLDIKADSITCNHRRVEYDIKHYRQEVEHAMHGFKLFEMLDYALEHGKPMKMA